VFERVRDPRPVGAGIMLQPIGMIVLQRLGLLEEVVARGARVDRLVTRTQGGTRLLDLAYSRHAPGLYGVGLHRGVLFDALLAAVRRSGAELRCGDEITGVRQGERGRRDPPRPSIVDAAGHRHGPFDLVIVAGGARSELRSDLAVRSSVRDYRWGVLWFVARDDGRAFDGELHQIVDGTRRMMGFLPTGLGPDGETPLVSFFWSIRDDRVPAFRRAELGAWKREVLDYEPRADIVLDQIESTADLLFADYRDVRMDTFHDGRVVVLGDAAHAMSPHLGQGANIALFDAMVLADCIAEVPDVPDALREYSARRKSHLGYYQWATRTLTPFFQSDAPFGGAIRDLFFPLARVLPPVARQMVATMCGLKLGLLFGAIPPPALSPFQR
jgi:2-polyprenyl-6-methoxyphenol hydroxylase-like FAD-dependent oxidoreductase